MEQLLWWPGYLVEEDEPIVRIAVTAFEKVMGYRPAITGKDAGTDASWINALAGIPVVMFSPGNGKNAMNADENVVIEDLVNATKVIAQIACDVVGA
jgi:acetylornithine deacetylase/succinyl-diaminopimelate desuccinylase-like protein